MITQIEKNIADNKEKLPLAEVSKVEKAIEDAKVVLKEKENDGDALQKATDDLMKASQKIAEIIYKEKSEQEKQAASGQQQGAQQNTNQSEEKTAKKETVDVDFEEK